MERSVNIGRRDGGGSCASAVDDTAQDECVGIYGIPEREKQFDDIPKMGCGKISISMQRILV